jgi:hypothetical protein
MKRGNKGNEDVWRREAVLFNIAPLVKNKNQLK